MQLIKRTAAVAVVQLVVANDKKRLPLLGGIFSDLHVPMRWFRRKRRDKKAIEREVKVKHRQALRTEVEADVAGLAAQLTNNQRSMVTAISERIYKDLKEIKCLDQQIRDLSGTREIGQEVSKNHEWIRNIETRIIELGGLRLSKRKVFSRWFNRHGPLFATAMGAGK